MLMHTFAEGINKWKLLKMKIIIIIIIIIIIMDKGFYNQCSCLTIQLRIIESILGLIVFIIRM